MIYSTLSKDIGSKNPGYYSGRSSRGRNYSGQRNIYAETTLGQSKKNTNKRKHLTKYLDTKKGETTRNSNLSANRLGGSIGYKSEYTQFQPDASPTHSTLHQANPTKLMDFQ